MAGLESLITSGYIITAITLYLAYWLITTLYSITKDYFILWQIATGGYANNAGSPKLRLHAYVCSTSRLDKHSVREISCFLRSMVDFRYTDEELHSILLKYDHVVFCREKRDGSMRGMLLMKVERRQKENGGMYTLMRLGSGFMQAGYQGGPLLYYVLSCRLLKELILHPYTPLYIIGKTFGYKSYLAFATTVKNFYPRYNTTTPSFEKRLLDNYAESMRFSGESYNQEGVIEREGVMLKENVSPISNEDLNNPHIQFFQEHNPGWRKGHQLCILAKVTWGDVIRGLSRKTLMRHLNAFLESDQNHTGNIA